MRNAFAAALYDAAKSDPRICVVVADISPAGPMAKFEAEFPGRFINVGVAEQAMIGMAAGLALKGMRPFCYTIATFALYRPFEFVRNDLAYQRLPVTIVGMGAGLIYSTLGSTHHAQEDVAVAGAIPNMQILAPCDPQECVEAVRHCAAVSAGPTYLRIGKSGEPALTDQAEPFAFGKLRYLRRGTDTCVIGYGPILKMAMDVLPDAAVVSCHTLKPLDRWGIGRTVLSYKRVIVIEEHAPTGGLSDQVKRIAWDTKATCQIDCWTLRDEFIHRYGTHAELLAEHGLKAELIA